ncbi:MAG TPA: hypothetical protein V6D28_14710 [Leptolyngbyaceae cyanobacterium]
MEANNIPKEIPIQQLRNVRNGMLRLHKALLESEKITYEYSHGKIPSKGEFFRLAIEDQWFSWLRPISQFIVLVDETLSAKEPVTFNQVDKLLKEARNLLLPSEEGTDSQKRYYSAIQNDPEVASLHLEVSRFLSNDA